MYFNWNGVTINTLLGSSNIYNTNKYVYVKPLPVTLYTIKICVQHCYIVLIYSRNRYLLNRSYEIIFDKKTETLKTNMKFETLEL